jgi:hypothetical protein
MDWKEFFKLNKPKIIILILIILVLNIFTPCVWDNGTRLCPPIHQTLLKSCNILYDANPPKMWGLLNYYTYGCDFEFYNYGKYLVILINPLISYFITCILYFGYSKIKSKKFYP